MSGSSASKGICVLRIIGKHSGYVQPLAVVLVRLVDAARQTLCQGIDSGDVVDVMPLYETGDAAPVVYQLYPVETLQEIEHSGMRFVGAEHLYRHRTGRVQVQCFRRMNQRHHLC